MFFFEIFFIERSTSKPENYKDFKLSHKLDCIKRFIGSDKSGKSFWKSSFIIHIWGNGLKDDRCFTRPAIAEKADYWFPRNVERLLESSIKEIFCP